MQPTVDLNLLLALDVLLREGSVTAAADKLHLSVPAMSRTLGRIRKAFGDPILVRSGRGLVPTPRALALREGVSALVEQAQALLSVGARLDPATLDREFTVLSNESMASTHGAALISAVRAAAPGVRLRFLAEGHQDTAALREGSLDLEIGVFGALPPELRVQALTTEHLVVVMRAGHPLARRPLTPARFAAAEHLGVSRRGRVAGPLDTALAELGLTRRVAATAPTFGAALAMVRHTDLITLAPAQHAAALGPALGLTHLDSPVPLEPVPVAMAWHRRFEADPAHRWLREQAAAVFRSSAVSLEA